MAQENTVKSITFVTASTTGGDGSATATGTSDLINGAIVGVHLDYSTGNPSTTDVTIGTTGTNSQGIVNKDNNSADSWFYPRTPVVNTGASTITNSFDNIYVNDSMVLTVSGTNSDQTVTARVLYKEA